jgi:hypothetical protein
MFLEASVAGRELLSRNAAPPEPELPDSSLPVIVSGLAQQEEEQSTQLLSILLLTSWLWPRNQLAFFNIYESGLQATWQTLRVVSAI